MTEKQKPRDRFAGGVSTPIEITMAKPEPSPGPNIRVTMAKPEPDEPDDNVYALLLDLRFAVGRAEAEWVSAGPAAGSVTRARENLAAIDDKLQALWAELGRAKPDAS